MKEGYEIQVQSDLPSNVKEEAIRWARVWGENHKTGYGVGKTTSSNQKTYFNRGSFGIWLNDKGWGFAIENSNLVFRRISRNRRVFAIVCVDVLERTDGQPIKIDQCACPQHRGGQKVRFKTRPEMETVFTWGDIKG